MIVPPMLVYLRIQTLRLWLPLFLLWPFVLLLALPLLVVVLIASPFVRGLGAWEAVRFCGGCYQVLCGLRGTSVSVEGATERIDFTLY
jgi:hypothetical protein